MLKELLLSLARNLVDQPDEVQVDQREGADGLVIYELRVAPADLGRIAKAIRTVMKAAAVKENKKVQVDIVD